MAYWLKLIGSWDEPVTEWTEPFVEFSGENGVPKIGIGDYLILYATRHRRLFAIARASSSPYSNEGIIDAWGKYRVNVTYDINCSVADGPHGNDFDPPFRSHGGGHHEITAERFEIVKEKLVENACI